MFCAWTRPWRQDAQVGEAFRIQLMASWDEKGLTEMMPVCRVHSDHAEPQ